MSNIRKRLDRLEQALRPVLDWADKPASARLVRVLELLLGARRRQGKPGAKAAADMAEKLGRLQAAIANTPGAQLEARCEAGLAKARLAMRRAREAGAVP